MTCIICEIGELKPGKTTFTMKRDKSIIVFDDVPALICENCGEEFFDEETNGKLLEKAEFLIWNLSFKKVITFSKIGVYRIGEQKS